MAALPQPPLVSVEDYLNTAYDPDVEYVDGVLVERHVGDRLHSLVQSNVLYFLRLRYPKLKVFPEWRSKVSDSRYRIPDLAVLLRDPLTRYLLEAPWIAIEILSEDDNMSVVIEKLKEYARQGCPNIWLIDPRLETVFVYRDSALTEVPGDVATADKSVYLSRAEIFAK